MNRTPNYWTIAALCGQQQRSFREIETAFAKAGCLPEMVLNGIKYFSEKSVEQMIERLPERRQRIEARRKG